MPISSGPDEKDLWEVDRTYVIGHQRPDTDAIASALGYAWYLTATGSTDIVAARAGQLTAQTTYALKRFNTTPPRLLNGVAPLFGHITDSQKALGQEAPLSEAMQQMAQGQRIVPILDAANKPVGAVTPLALARVYAAISENPQSASDVLNQPCQQVIEEVPTFKVRQRISDHRPALLRMGTDDILVVDEAGVYLGTATRSHVLEPPRARLILVDHNELGQAITGADEAQIVAVLDHHRLGNASTTLPIPFMVEPVGSTCTLVAEKCRLANTIPPGELAGVMLSGILSDTLVFRSPTTTQRDRDIAGWLGELAQVDPNEYGEQLLQVTPGLMVRPIDDILDGDRKNYEMAGRPVSVGQVEVTNLQELPQRIGDLLQGLQDRRERENLSLICLMVTDVVTGNSHLLCQGDAPLLAALPYTRLGEGEWNLGKIVSRKKQLVPALSDVLENVSG